MAGGNLIKWDKEETEEFKARAILNCMLRSSLGYYTFFFKKQKTTRAYVYFASKGSSSLTESQLGPYTEINTEDISTTVFYLLKF